jgi:magnesium transporter
LQEIDFILTRDHLFTVSKATDGAKPFDLEQTVKKANDDNATPGVCAYRLIDAMAEQYLDLVDQLDDDIDMLDDKVGTWTARQVRDRVSELRHDILHVRRALTPMRDLARSIVDERIDVGGRKSVFPREVLLQFADSYDKFLRASDSLELSRDLLGGVRDYFQSQIANDQNEVMKRLTVISAMLLAPTFIVGLYGQNLKIPELHWHYGYLWSWALIVVVTAAQFRYFRKKGWV